MKNTFIEYTIRKITFVFKLSAETKFISWSGYVKNWCSHNSLFEVNLFLIALLVWPTAELYKKHHLSVKEFASTTTEITYMESVMDLRTFWFIEEALHLWKYKTSSMVCFTFFTVMKLNSAFVSL